MFNDVRGLPLTVRSPNAAELYNAAAEQYLLFRGEFAETLRTALAADAECVMAHVLAGAVLRMANNDALLPRARAHLAAAEAHAGPEHFTLKCERRRAPPHAPLGPRAPDPSPLSEPLRERL